MEFDFIVVNDDFDRARADLVGILRAWPLRRRRQQRVQQARLDDLLRED